MTLENRTVLKIIGVFAFVGVVAYGCILNKADELPPVASSPPEPKAQPVREQPVSADCEAATRRLQSLGVIKPGDIDRNGATILVDKRWASMPFDLQKGSAECISHKIAGAQDRWISRIVFRNQITGVVYGTIEGQRYRTGE